MAQAPAPVTRFAPSPTGFLHIGGVRTAIFNWLYARARGGRFLLRIEDTDRARSTPEAVQAILEGLAWMGLESDSPPVYQASRADRHREVVQTLLARGHAYPCYCTPEELTAMRERAIREGLPRAYDGTWRDRNAHEAPAGVDPVIRFRAVQDGTSTLEDAVQGTVTRPNATADDLILLRADGTPTYNLCVVVDDNDMGVTHVIRGDDHLNNAFRQKQIYKALGWDLPTFAHIPLIHGLDGAKLSKRHGALGIESYRDQGYMADGLFSYLLKLGWSHGDEDYVSRERALELFGFNGIGRSPSRLDLEKLRSTHKTYQDCLDPKILMREACKFDRAELDAPTIEMIDRAALALQERSATLADVAVQFAFFTAELPLSMDDKAQRALSDDGPAILGKIAPILKATESWDESTLATTIETFAAQCDVKVGKVFQPLRAALTGTMSSPGVTQMMVAFGPEKTLAHIHSAIESSSAIST